LELDEYQSWRDQPCGLLWIKGKPGAGKSTLMDFLHDRLEESQDGIHSIIRLDFFFTARGTEIQRTPLGMLRSLLNQIFDRDATIRPQVREIYKQRYRQFGHREYKWEWPQTILEELLATAILASATEKPVIIFVDALDEAGAESAQKLTEYFHCLIDRADRKKLTLQVCISSRHYPIIESARARTIHIEDHNQDDIASYVKDMLLETELGDIPSQEMREVLVELTQHANGVFQWARLTIPLVKRKIAEGESLSDIRHWLAERSADLEDVYVYILRNIIAVSNREQSFLFFQWMCLAERPLTVTEMRYALTAKNTKRTPSPTPWEKIESFVRSNGTIKRRIKALSGGLAEVVSSGNDEETVQVVHQSVNDFLRAKGLLLLYHSISGRAGSMGIDNILIQSQANLYRSCLVYLATICSNKQMDHFQRSKDNLVCDHPFLSYTAINLFIHAEKAAGSQAALLQNEKDILHQIIRLWAQIYRRLDEHGTGCPPISTELSRMAECVLSDGEIIARKDGIGNTALHFAARAGLTVAGKILQERGANREAKNDNGSTPLMEATKCGHLGFVKWLLDEGVDVNVTAGGSCAVSMATRSRNGDILELLLSSGAHIETALQTLDSADDQIYLKQQALDFAAAAGNQNMVKFLISIGANVNHASKSDLRVPLHLAAESGQIDVVTTLLDANADPTMEDSLSRDVLHYANLSGSTSFVRALERAIGQYNKGFKLGLCYRAKTGAFLVHKVQINKRMSDYTLLSDILHVYKQRRCQGLRRYSLRGLSGVKPVKVK
jgi:adenylate kinase family enzyme